MNSFSPENQEKKGSLQQYLAALQEYKSFLEEGYKRGSEFVNSDPGFSRGGIQRNAELDRLAEVCGLSYEDQKAIMDEIGFTNSLRQIEKGP